MSATCYVVDRWARNLDRGMARLVVEGVAGHILSFACVKGRARKVEELAQHKILNSSLVASRSSLLFWGNKQYDKERDSYCFLLGYDSS